MTSRPLTLSIARTVGLLLLVQTALIVVCSLAYRLALSRSALFVLITLLYHGALLGVLLSLRSLFVLLDEGRPLQRVNTPNTLSLVRLSSLPSVVFLIISAREAQLMPVILPALVVVFLTDFLDGRLARRRGEVTRIGRYLDAVSDYMILSATLFVYLSYSLIPWWFFLLVVVRLGIVAGGNVLLYALQGYIEPETSYLGKASVFAIMVLFAAKILAIPYGLLVHGPSPLTLERLDDLQLLVSGVILVSAFEKVSLIGARLRTARPMTGTVRESERVSAAAPAEAKPAGSSADRQASTRPARTPGRPR